MKAVAISLLCLLIVLCLGGWLTRPKPLSPATEIYTFAGSVEEHLATAEARANGDYGLVDGTEKRVVWAAEPGERSEYVVIYLHGFSATRQELAPVPELVAKELGANLFETRLQGHGRERSPLQGLPAEAWLDDAREALAIGKALGDKLIVLGVSTGATLALTLAEHPDFAAVDTLVFLSPNFGPAAPGSGLATGPYGPQITRLFAGPTHSWEPANELQAKYWTTSYPTTSIIEMMRLVDLANQLLPAARVPNALLVYSPQDDVISVPKALAGFERLTAARKDIHVLEEPDSISPHVFAGDILGPAENSNAVQVIVSFLRGAP